MKILFIINDAPYGTEKAYNALRMAMTMQKENAEADINIFLMADAVGCALPNQNTPNGYYNIERMLKGVLNKGGKVKACGSCTEARGIKNLPLIEGVEISNMPELAKWTIQAEKVLTF
ncbi:MAG: hypothetical protein EHM47_10180 [Ignavibacteriales bacterium]|nr:MAG: hypothetical protein EHM47_10180 [Ignavibacteriales bacterium]